MKAKVEQLIEILEDPTARIDERDDAAIYIANFPTRNVLSKLIDLARNNTENHTVLASLGESIGEIMIAMNKFDFSAIEGLSPVAKKEALGIIKGKKPEWLE